MYTRTATLTRMAAAAPLGLDILLRAMSKRAKSADDIFARASYIGGLMGEQPGRVNARSLAEARAALSSGDPNPIIDHLLYERELPQDLVEDLIGTNDRKLFEALESGARKAIPHSLRGIEAMDVVQALAMGLSPATLKPLGKYRGGNVFWFLGKTAGPGMVSLGALAKNLQKQGFQQAADLEREEDSTNVSLSTPATNSDEGSAETLQDVLSGDSSVSRADYISMVDAIFNTPAVLRALNSQVRRYLAGPAQEIVWDVVSKNPSLITVRDGAIGVEARRLAEKIGEVTNVAITPQAAGKTWRMKVYPAMMKAFKDSSVGDSLLRNRQIMEVIDEESRRRTPSRHKIRNIGRLANLSRQASAAHVAARYASTYSLNDLAEGLIGQSGKETLALLRATRQGQEMLWQYFKDVFKGTGGEYLEVDLDGTSHAKGSGPTGHALFERGSVVLGLQLSERGQAEGFWRREVDGRFQSGTLPLFSLTKAATMAPAAVAKALMAAFKSAGV